MKRKPAFTLLTAAVLASLFLLGACGQKKEEEAAPASSSQTSQVSQSSSTSSKKESAASASAQTDSQAGQSNQAATPASSAQTGGSAAAAEPAQGQTQSQNQQPASPAQQPQPAQRANIAPAGNPRYKGVLALADGDFSKAAGSWEDGQGNVITIGGNGSISIQQSGQEAKNYTVGSYAYTLDDGKYTAQLTSPTPGAGTPGLQIITGADGNVTSVQLVK